MKSTYFWTLEIHYCPKIVAAGLTPVEFHGTPFAKDWKPEHYRPSVFRYTNAPSRQDFVNGLTDLERFDWQDTLVAGVLDGSIDWPMIDRYHEKSADSIIYNADGKLIGRLVLRRTQFHVSRGYDLDDASVPSEAEQAVLKCFPINRRFEAVGALHDAANRIREAMIALPAEERSDQERKTESARRIMRQVLVDAGFLGKTKRKQAIA